MWPQNDDKAKAHLEDGTNIDKRAAQDDSSPESKFSLFSIYFLTNIVLAVSFLLVFTAFGGVQNLETSLDLGDVSGNLVVGLIYIFFTISCLVAPKIVSLLGSKACILLQEINLGLFIATHFAPRTWSMYTSAVLVGCGSGIMWVAQGQYVSFLAQHHAIALADVEGKPANPSSVVGMFQGSFFCLFQASQVTGNLISSGLFTSTGGSVPPTSVVNTMFVVYIVCVGAGASLLFFFARNPNQLLKYEQAKEQKSIDFVSKDKRDGEETTQVQTPTIGLLDPLRLLRDPKMALLVPMFFLTGFEVGFAWGDFTNLIIKPTLGVANIGFIMAIFGGADAVSSFTVGRVSDKIGRPTIAVVGFVVHIVCCITLLVRFATVDKATRETPSSSNWTTIVVVAFLWGIGNAVWNTMTSALLAARFPVAVTEPAFGLFRMFMALGVSVAFFYGPYVSLTVKLIVLLVVIGVSAVCYAVDLVVFGLEKPTEQQSDAAAQVSE